MSNVADNLQNGKMKFNCQETTCEMNNVYRMGNILILMSKLKSVFSFEFCVRANLENVGGNVTEIITDWSSEVKQVIHQSRWN